MHQSRTIDRTRQARSQQPGVRAAHPAVAVASPSSSALRIPARLSGAGGSRHFCLSAQRVPASPGSLREMMAVGVRLSNVLITAALAFWGRTAHAYMSPMCCGDNFCCAVESTGSVSCWGGNSFDTVMPSGTTLGSLSRISHIACAGKSLVVVNSALQIAAVLGTTGYGADSFPANLIGSTVRDISVSFWGGAFISGSDGSITTWGQDATYSSSATSQSWYPSSDSSGRGCSCTTAERRMAFTNIPSAGTFSKVACGGKRAGHFCCVVSDASSSADNVQCFGDGTGTYTPARAELSAQGALSLSGNDAVHSVSAGCDFLCVLTESGKLGVYTHSSGQLWESSWPTAMPRGADGLQTGSLRRYKQVTCGTFGVYAVGSTDGTLSAWGRVFSRSSGPVSARTDVTGTAASFYKYVQRDSSKTFAFMSANSGYGHACGVDTGGRAVCWGADYSHQATNGNMQSGITIVNIQIHPALLPAAPGGGATQPPAINPCSCQSCLDNGNTVALCNSCE
jgi:alpha-tubulin suppressor-like RCC1 family protein